MLTVTDVITDLHLLLNQVLCLDKAANELITFLFLEMSDLVLMDYISDLKLLLLGLKLMLLVYELLSEDALLVV